MAARMMKPICMLLIAVVLAVAVPRNQAAITCGTVVSSLKPCASYVFNNAPIAGCCNGVRSLYGAAKTPADRKTVCNCLKSLAGSYTGASLGKAAGIPSKCGINIPYKISPSTDCSRVN